MSPVFPFFQSSTDCLSSFAETDQGFFLLSDAVGLYLGAMLGGNHIFKHPRLIQHGEMLTIFEVY